MTTPTLVAGWKVSADSPTINFSFIFLTNKTKFVKIKGGRIHFDSWRVRFCETGARFHWRAHAVNSRVWSDRGWREPLFLVGSDAARLFQTDTDAETKVKWVRIEDRLSSVNCCSQLARASGRNSRTARARFENCSSRSSRSPRGCPFFGASLRLHRAPVRKTADRQRHTVGPVNQRVRTWNFWLKLEILISASSHFQFQGVL